MAFSFQPGSVLCGSLLAASRCRLEHLSPLLLSSRVFNLLFPRLCGSGGEEPAASRAQKAEPL